mmetsp:Transcript_14530/g.37038  ORF Transcript_14530/g.37038 Transcript_14530/m.37038 type:complete len:278 (+) Transcript_14530:145-978(+)
MRHTHHTVSSSIELATPSFLLGLATATTLARGSSGIFAGLAVTVDLASHLKVVVSLGYSIQLLEQRIVVSGSQRDFHHTLGRRVLTGLGLAVACDHSTHSSDMGVRNRQGARHFGLGEGQNTLELLQQILHLTVCRLVGINVKLDLVDCVVNALDRMRGLGRRIQVVLVNIVDDFDALLFDKLSTLSSGEMQFTLLNDGLQDDHGFHALERVCEVSIGHAITTRSVLEDDITDHDLLPGESTLAIGQYGTGVCHDLEGGLALLQTNQLPVVRHAKRS